MKFIILGSGGAFQIPRAGCRCKVCDEARKKGIPYRRHGQSMYFCDLNMLFDTPECISAELNENSIFDIEHICYSHFHPDHTMGMRIVEELKDFKNEKALMIHLPTGGVTIGINEFSSLIDFYTWKNLCYVTYDQIFIYEGYSVKRIKLNNEYADGFLITQGEKKVFYCPCHTKELSCELEELMNCDLMILGMGEINDPDEECTDFRKDTLKVVDHYKPKKAVMTHIEETDGLSYDDFCKLELELKVKNIVFAYDGMVIEV